MRRQRSGTEQEINHNCVALYLSRVGLFGLVTMNNWVDRINELDAACAVIEEIRKTRPINLHERRRELKIKFEFNHLLTLFASKSVHVRSDVSYPLHIRAMEFRDSKHKEVLLRQFLVKEDQILALMGQPMGSSSLHRAASQVLREMAEPVVSLFHMYGPPPSLPDFQTDLAPAAKNTGLDSW